MSSIEGTRQRLRELLQSSRVAAELDDELSGDHFERELDRQRDAVVPAEVALPPGPFACWPGRSGQNASRTAAPGIFLPTSSRGFLRFGARGIRRNPGLATAIVLSLLAGALVGPRPFQCGRCRAAERPLAFPYSEELHQVRVWWKDFSANLSVADFLAVSDMACSSAE